MRIDIGRYSRRRRRRCIDYTCCRCRLRRVAVRMSRHNNIRLSMLRQVDFGDQFNTRLQSRQKVAGHMKLHGSTDEIVNECCFAYYMR